MLVLYIIFYHSLGGFKTIKSRILRCFGDETLLEHPMGADFDDLASESVVLCCHFERHRGLNTISMHEPDTNLKLSCAAVERSECTRRLTVCAATYTYGAYVQ